MHAEPITFGLKCASWYAELSRDRRRLAAALAEIAFGKLSGAVGTFANHDPAVEAAILARLGLEPEPIATQVVPRDRHAVYFTTAILGGALEHRDPAFTALEVGGSRAVRVGPEELVGVPHKRNPILVRSIWGRTTRARLRWRRSRASRSGTSDIGHSSVERVAPDATIALDFALARLGRRRGLEVRPEAMAANLARTSGAVFSEQVLLALVRKGVARDQAYRWIQRHALAGGDLATALTGDADVRTHLDAAEIASLFDITHSLRHIDALFARALEDG